MPNLKLHARMWTRWLSSRVSHSSQQWRSNFASRAKSRRDVISFTLWHLRPLLDLALLAVALMGIVSAIIFVSINFDQFALISAVVVFFSLALELVKLFNAWPSVNIVNNTDVSTIIEKVEGATKMPNKKAYVIRSDEIDKELRSGRDFTLSLTQCQYNQLLLSFLQDNTIMETALKWQLRRAIRAIPPKGFWNERKLCLASDLDTTSSTVKYYVGSYYVSFLTNELCMRRIETIEAHPRCQFGKDGDAFPADKQGDSYVLKPIEQSQMGNHIGVSTIAHTADNFLVLWRQTNAALHSENLVAPTGSGSCDDIDLDANSLIATVKNGMAREYSEESSERGKHEMKLKLRTEVERIEVLGYFRSLIRGGKPEFVGTAKLRSKYADLRPNIDEVDLPEYLLPRMLARSIDELVKHLDTTLQRDDLSIPVWINIICLKEALAEDPSRWTKFFFE